jgi:RES domain-containing protein
MIQKALRIVKPQHVGNAFDGEGARLYGGRWNSKGTSVIYVSESISLAAMELLVHFESHKVLESYICIPVEFDEIFVLNIDMSNLPKDWNKEPAPLSTKNIGDSWIKSGSSLLLKIPSVIIPSEINFLINPAHPDFNKITIRPPQPFDFDKRLLKAYIR